jgi:hypothetical protein
MNLIESITYAQAVSQSVAPLTATVTFPNVAADTYTVKAQAIDATGARLGAAVSTTLVVRIE